jgi:hypothetical protein
MPAFPSWQRPQVVDNVRDVIGFLRIVGVMNAAVWLGSAVFFNFLIAPLFSSPEALSVLTWKFSGWLAQGALEKHFQLNLWCAGIALLHLVAECVYLGRPLSRFHLFLLAALLCLTLLGNFWLQPRLEQLHVTRYHQRSTPVEVQQATRGYNAWNGVTQFLNYLTLAGILVYLWQVTGLNSQARFGSKFRS